MKRVNQRRATLTTFSTREIKKATYKALKMKIWLIMKLQRRDEWVHNWWSTHSTWWDGGVQKGNKETPWLVEIDSPSTPLDEPNINLVEKTLRPRYALKSHDIIGIDVDRYSCSINSMNNSLNYMPCSNNDYIDRLDFVENEKEETFMFEPINPTSKEPLTNYELSAIHETYASLVCTLTCCYNSHVMLIMYAYVYNKFCKSWSWFALGQANDLKKAHVGRRPIFTNHVDKARIIKKEVVPKRVAR
jgi:hypothetical protein